VLARDAAARTLDEVRRAFGLKPHERQMASRQRYAVTW
jgi:hypothetical protein